MQFQGEALDPAHPKGTRQRFVSPGFFEAMGTRILQGRDFGPEDAPGTPATAIVNRTFVKRYLDGRDPIGVQFAAGYPAPNPQNTVTVVGVVDDIRQKSVDLEAEPAFYSSVTQVPFRRLTMVVTTSVDDPGPVLASIREQVRKADPQIAVNFERVRDLVDATISRQQLGMTLMLIFGGVAVLLAAIGIYGVVAYGVSLRRDEMATRLALGASPVSVFWLVMRHGAHSRGDRHRHRSRHGVSVGTDCGEPDLRDSRLGSADADHGDRHHRRHRGSGDGVASVARVAAESRARAASGVVVLTWPWRARRRPWPLPSVPGIRAS